MGHKNPIYDYGIYFLTLTVVDWIDIFSRANYKHIIVDSLAYCQNEKGLILYAWVVMTNHIHLIATAREGYNLSDILRDLKKFTSKKILREIEAIPESRREWLLYRFQYAASSSNESVNYKFWQDGNEPKDLFTLEFTEQKLNYLHQNPVRAEIVNRAEDYRYSSAIDYAGGKGLLNVELLF
jgi:hypothetical protein